MINCKNCTIQINENDNFCTNCGAKIIKEKITLKSLFSNLLTGLGWDSNFFITLRYLSYKPQTVFKEYINGTRKKYTNPFSLLAIISAISIFIFSQYSNELIQMSTDFSFNNTDVIENKVLENTNKNKGLEIFGFKNQTEFNEVLMKFQLKYYNLFAFLLLPFYTLISFLVFRKPYNFGEHLVINTYLQSITSFFSVLLFIFSLLIGINLFGTGITILPFLYYCFAFKKLYKLTFGQLLLKVLKFFGILILFFITLSLLGVAIGFLFMVITK